MPLLEQAQRINPSSYDNGYDLAMAYFLTGKLAEARQQSRAWTSKRTPGNFTTCSAR